MENSGNVSGTINGMVQKVASCPYLLALVAGVVGLAVFGKKKTYRRRRISKNKKSTPKRRKRK